HGWRARQRRAPAERRAAMGVLVPGGQVGAKAEVEVAPDGPVGVARREVAGASRRALAAGNPEQQRENERVRPRHAGKFCMARTNGKMAPSQGWAPAGDENLRGA